MKHYATVLDLETTGLDPEYDQITEIGLIKFVWSGGPEVGLITNMYSALQKVSVDIPEVVTELTGLTSEHVDGESIDWEEVDYILSASDYIIAHNAVFDKGFLQKQTYPHPAYATGRPHAAGEGTCNALDGFKGKWACSMNHIDWKAKGSKTKNLEYLACDQGFLNPFPHRALFDAATTYKLILPHLAELFGNCRLPSWTISAYKSAFQKKDILKARGYYWRPEEKVWSMAVIGHDSLEEEKEFLRRDVYYGAASIEHTNCSIQQNTELL